MKAEEKSMARHEFLGVAYDWNHPELTSLEWREAFNQWTEMIVIGGVEFPSWIIERARQQQIYCGEHPKLTEIEALEITAIVIRAEANATWADPNERIRPTNSIIIGMFAPKK